MKVSFASTEWIDSNADPLLRYDACLAMAKGYASSKKSDKMRLAHAKAFCAIAVESYWDAVCERNKASLPVKSVELDTPSLPVDVNKLASAAGRLISQFPVEDAGFLAGNIYTAMLPSSRRSALGAFYTPPPLVKRLIEMTEASGFNFATGNIIDPACGGGAFLVPLAQRILDQLDSFEPAWKLRQLEMRLHGCEIDEFAAWIADVVLEASVLPLCIVAKRRLSNVVTVEDSLRTEATTEYDLVIGNPPYGRISLTKSMRAKYARSLFGHANLYGLFTDLALRLAKPRGFVAYVTPTSFLGGQYFKSLRQLLTSESLPISFDIVSDRNGVFDDVLQETILTVFHRSPEAELTDKAVIVSALVPQGLNSSRIEPIGNVPIKGSGDPWLLPRTADDASFLHAISKMPTRLSDIFYCVSTGPLVWNRHRDQLRTERGADTFPLVWAESVSSDGFKFKAEKRNHVPFIAIKEKQPHLVTGDSCVLVQRTTSKEQGRRLVASVLPASFIAEHGGAVVENHLNIVCATKTTERPSISVSTISTLLNTSAADRAFRCISGSVAVSAYELNALPLPSPIQIAELESRIEDGASREAVELLVASYYGIN